MGTPDLAIRYPPTSFAPRRREMLVCNSFAVLSDDDRDPSLLLADALKAAEKAKPPPPPPKKKPADAATKLPAVTVAKGAAGGSGGESAGSDGWEVGSEDSFYYRLYGRKPGATEEEELGKYPDRWRKYKNKNRPRILLRLRRRHCRRFTMLSDEDDDRPFRRMFDRRSRYGRGSVFGASFNLAYPFICPYGRHSVR